MKIKFGSIFNIHSTLRIVSLTSLFIFIGLIVIKILYWYYEISIKYDFLLDLFIDITLSIAISYFFFLIVYIPELKRNNSINKYIENLTIKILHELKNIESLRLIISSSKVNIMKDTPSLKSGYDLVNGKRKFLTYRENITYIFNAYIRFREEITIYLPHMENELRECYLILNNSPFLDFVENIVICSKQINNDFIVVFFTKNSLNKEINMLEKWRSLK
ncbi:hypothetical protein RJG79_08190 [Mycoplasmatota bacterium WC44]